MRSAKSYLNSEWKPIFAIIYVMHLFQSIVYIRFVIIFVGHLVLFIGIWK